MKLALATFNQHKIAEIAAILGVREDDFVPLNKYGISELPAEDAATFVENALIKARYVCQQTGVATLADDSGLCVDALDGAPGVLSARFGLYGLSSGVKTDNVVESDYAVINQKLVTMLQQYGDTAKVNAQGRYTAHYVCAAVLVQPGGTEHVSIGRCPGSVVSAVNDIRGANGFGYDPCFVPDVVIADMGDKTMAELSADQKNAISHRKAAFEGLKQWLK